MDVRIGTDIKGLWRNFLDLAFPPLCMICRAEVAAPGHLCADCWKAVHFLDGPVCAVCGIPFPVDPGEATVCGACLAHPPHFDQVRAVLRYDEHCKAAILALKHADRLDLAPGFARWLLRTGGAMIGSADLVAAVPLHRWRLWRRRYNQSAELARLLARQGGVPFVPDLLLRLRATKSQGEMRSAKARRRNVHGAFTVDARRRALLRDKTVLLIDDVVTTGATVDACALALKRAGAAKVWVLSLARVVGPAAESL